MKFGSGAAPPLTYLAESELISPHRFSAYQKSRTEVRLLKSDMVFIALSSDYAVTDIELADAGVSGIKGT